MKRRQAPAATLRAARGFTLVELMVAMVAGMFVAIAVFTLAKHASAFAMRQSRIADATLQSVIGFERLKTDIARAGFLSSPNIARDPAVCSGSTSAPGYPAWLMRLASIYIENSTNASTESTVNGITPRSIVLAGAYSTSDLFVARTITQQDPPVVYLQRNSLGMANIGYAPVGGAVALARVFRTNHALRIVDDAGGVQFAQITGVTEGVNPTVTLAATPAVQFRAGSVSNCGVRGHGNDFVNPIDFIRYDLRNLNTSAYASMSGMFRGGPSYEATRRELVRVEQDVTGAEIPSTLELVAEYAVDLNFSLIVAANTAASLTRLSGANVATYAGDVTGLSAGNGPQLIRAVHAWLSVRSQEADRDNGLALVTTAPGPNLLRISMDPADATRPPFARVRTLQSTIPLPNQANVTWQ
jgi:prepilin-type N-terminal cleavage/methylation domain-containing protein